MLQFLKDNYAYIMTVLFVISEGLAMIPGLKSNSIFQAIFNFLKSAVSENPSKGV